MADSNRFMRNKDLIDQKLLKSVSVIGAGGVGSMLIPCAAMMGFKKFVLWDNETLEEHNLSTTAYPDIMIGRPKVKAATESIRRYCNAKWTHIAAKNELWFPNCDLEDIVFMAPDNMETRLSVWRKWRTNPNRICLVDMRMGALGIEVITLSKDNSDYFPSTWKASTEISDEPCTAKHTIFTATTVSGIGLSQAFNVLHDKPFYSYIWMSLSPFKVVREGFNHNMKNGVVNEESQEETVIG